MRTTADQELAAARQTVAQFDDANRGLIQAATDEMPVVVHHQRVKAAYDGFLPEIQAYLTALPGFCYRGWETKPAISTTHSTGPIRPAICCTRCGCPWPRTARSRWSSPASRARATTR